MKINSGIQGEEANWIGTSELGKVRAARLDISRLSI